MGFLNNLLRTLFSSSPQPERETIYNEITEEEILWEDPWDMQSHPSERPLWRDSDGDGIPDCWDIAPLLGDDDDDD